MFSIAGHRIPPGVSHGDDLPYLFQIPTLDLGAAADAGVSADIVRAWVSFAATGVFESDIGGPAPVCGRGGEDTPEEYLVFDRPNRIGSDYAATFTQRN